MGAGAAQFGTRFMLSREAHLHAAYSQQLLSASVADTMVVGRGLGMIRVLRNGFAERMSIAEAEGRPFDERKAICAAASLKAAAFDGDIEGGKIEAGQSAGLVDDISPAADIVASIARDYAATVAARPRPKTLSFEGLSHAG